MSTPTKLRLVLDDAKRHLGERAELLPPQGQMEENGSTTNPARSKLNTLRGVTSVNQRPVSLFQRVGVPQRPTYDLIAERVLGPNVPEHRSFLDEGSTYADHVAERLRHLQDRLNAQPLDEQSPSPTTSFVGVEDDGRPVWSQVLAQQRGQASHALRPPEEEDAPLPARPAVSNRPVPDWPPRLAWSNQRTFKHWFVAEENFEATRLCEAVVDEPGVRFNPLLITGESAAGTSLLLHATGQALLRRNEGHVLIISAGDLHGVDPTSVAWQEGLAGATALLVDDVHAFASNDVWKHPLGVLLDRALNLGIQVVGGSRTSLEALPSSRLKEVLTQATVASLAAPSVGTMMAYARWRCTQKNMLLGDVHLAQVARESPSGWAAIDQRLERISLALESGEVLLDHDDLSPLLTGSTKAQEPELERKRVEDVAASMVGEVLDSVYSHVDAGGIDLRVDLKPWEEDHYVPPALDEDLTAAEHTEGFERQLAQTIENITPGRPTVLDVHEREQYLVSNREGLDLADVERAVDVLVDLDEGMDARLLRSQQNSDATGGELNRLEERMVALGRRALEADIDELITIADELRSIEERLVELDPSRTPLPPFEEDVPSTKRRKVGRRRSPRPTAKTSVALDSYEPEGEWNIDGEGVSAEDLLGDGSDVKTPVRLARLRPRTVLVGEEE